MSMTEILHARLTEAFAPDQLEIVDESEGHRGHAGYQEGGESHFRVTIRAAAFASMGRVERHRAVHAALGPAVIARIHALALDVAA
jgi:BolA family transcriptional regulator, general stress-responsive regulator